MFSVEDLESLVRVLEIYYTEVIDTYRLLLSANAKYTLAFQPTEARAFSLRVIEPVFDSASSGKQRG